MKGNIELLIKDLKEGLTNINELEIDHDEFEYERIPFLIQCKSHSEVINAIDMLNEFTEDGIISILIGAGFKSQYIKLNSTLGSKNIIVNNEKINVSNAIDTLFELKQTNQYPWFITGLIFDSSNQTKDKMDYIRKKSDGFFKISFYEKKIIC